MDNLIDTLPLKGKARDITKKVINRQRLSIKDGLFLYQEAELGLLAILANYAKKINSGDFVYFNKNFHLEPTNICVFNCKFCSYRKNADDKEAWDFSIDEMLNKVRNYNKNEISEIHIVGGVHPNKDLHYYGDLILKIKEILPDIHIKAFTAIEIDYMIKLAGYNLQEGLIKLKEYGLDSIPGGGAEIFDPEIRGKICGDKSSGEMWLKTHHAAHKAGIQTNATILYGHLEDYSHRVDHMIQLRELQDKTGGFNTFIPLKYRNQNNSMSQIGEVNINEDLRNYAVSRLILDNFPHIKAYWPMIGLETSRLALSFGVDDLDGTIDDSTKIYTMAGVKNKKSMTTSELTSIIKDSGRIPIERDTLYNHIKEYR